MSIERWVRLMAGSMVLVSLALAQWASHYWLLLTLFVGLNLLQSSVTGWCPAENILAALGVSGQSYRVEKPKGNSV